LDSKNIWSEGAKKEERGASRKALNLQASYRIKLRGVVMEALIMASGSKEERRMKKEKMKRDVNRTKA